MAVYEIIPRGVQLHFDDVVDTLAANGGTGLTSADASSLFTTEANIRWDAKRKPIVRAEYFPDYNGTWWKGTDGWCGLNAEGGRHAGSAEGLWSALSGKIDGKMNGWRYVLPTGGAASPYRIGDFEGYATKGNMIGGYSIDSKAGTSMGGLLNAEIPLTISNEETLSWSDFDALGKDTPDALKNYYFGVILTSGTYMIARTSSQPLGISTKVSLVTEGLRDGTWMALPFISQYPILEEKDHGITGIFYTVPNTKITEVTLAADSPYIEINAQKVTPLTITGSILIYNPRSSAVVYTNNTVALREGNSEVNSMTATLGTITVPAQSSVTVDIPAFEFVSPTLYNNCKVWVFLNGNGYVASAIPLEPAEVLATIGL